MIVYTIGFTKKSARQFFELLVKNGVTKLIDIRLNNDSQLAGFAKGRDLDYFLGVIGKIASSHQLQFAPTKELLDGYKAGTVSWQQYETDYRELLKNRNALDNVLPGDFHNACLLCSEDEPTHCHRRLLAEAIKEKYPDLEIRHLQ